MTQKVIQNKFIAIYNADTLEIEGEYDPTESIAAGHTFNVSYDDKALYNLKHVEADSIEKLKEEKVKKGLKEKDKVLIEMEEKETKE